MTLDQLATLLAANLTAADITNADGIDNLADMILDDCDEWDFLPAAAHELLDRTRYDRALCNELRAALLNCLRSL